jgi:hypothetical protein
MGEEAMKMTVLGAAVIVAVAIAIVLLIRGLDEKRKEK